MSGEREPVGCGRCRGAALISGGPHMREVAEAPGAVLFQCRACSTFWVDPFGQHPRMVSPSQAQAEFPDFGNDRPDDGSPWVS